MLFWRGYDTLWISDHALARWHDRFGAATLHQVREIAYECRAPKKRELAVIGPLALHRLVALHPPTGAILLYERGVRANEFVVVTVISLERKKVYLDAIKHHHKSKNGRKRNRPKST